MEGMWANMTTPAPRTGHRSGALRCSHRPASYAPQQHPSVDISPAYNTLSKRLVRTLRFLVIFLKFFLRVQWSTISDFHGFSPTGNGSYCADFATFDRQKPALPTPFCVVFTFDLPNYIQWRHQYPKELLTNHRGLNVYIRIHGRVWNRMGGGVPNTIIEWSKVS